MDAGSSLAQLDEVVLVVYRSLESSASALLVERKDLSASVVVLVALVATPRIQAEEVFSVLVDGLGLS